MISFTGGFFAAACLPVEESLLGGTGFAIEDFPGAGFPLGGAAVSGAFSASFSFAVGGTGGGPLPSLLKIFSLVSMDPLPFPFPGGIFEPALSDAPVAPPDGFAPPPLPAPPAFGVGIPFWGGAGDVLVRDLAFSVFADAPPPLEDETEGEGLRLCMDRGVAMEDAGGLRLEVEDGIPEDGA